MRRCEKRLRLTYSKEVEVGRRERERVLHHRMTLLKHAKLNNMFSFGKSIKQLNHIKLLTELSGNPFTNTYSGRYIFESMMVAIPCRHISTYISVYLYTYIHTCYLNDALLTLRNKSHKYV